MLSVAARQHAAAISNCTAGALEKLKMYPPVPASQFPDASFDCIVDKGGLDAIAGEGIEDLEGLQAAANLLSEVRCGLSSTAKWTGLL